MGAAAFIFKPRTPLSTEWFRRLTKVMEEKYERLKQNPAVYAREWYNQQVNYEGRSFISKYPLRWEETHA